MQKQSTCPYGFDKGLHLDNTLTPSRCSYRDRELTMASRQHSLSSCPLFPHRQDSIFSYTAGGRLDLVEQEEAEVGAWVEWTNRYPHITLVYHVFACSLAQLVWACSQAELWGTGLGYEPN